MAEYVNKDAVRVNMCKKLKNPVVKSWIGAMIAEIPAADVAPVKHGKWIFDAENYEWNCSECHDWPIDGSFDDDRTNYCPNCGAKMDGEE